MKNKTIENEQTHDKMFNLIWNNISVILCLALIIVGIYCASEKNNKTNKGTYHDYNKAIIIYGKNDGVVIDLADTIMSHLVQNVMNCIQLMANSIQLHLMM